MAPSARFQSAKAAGVPCRGTVIYKNCKIRGKESINERKRHRKKFRWRFCFAVSNELLQNKLGKW